MAAKHPGCIGSAAVNESWTHSISIESPLGTLEPEETVSLLINGLPHKMSTKDSSVVDL